MNNKQIIIPFLYYDFKTCPIYIKYYSFSSYLFNLENLRK